jgi:hypothetical protein
VQRSARLSALRLGPDVAKLASFSVEEIEAIGRWSFDINKLGIDSGWLRFATS